MKHLFRVLEEYIRRHEYLFLSVLILLGAVLRFSLLPYTDWFGDPACDTLVGRHILLYHELPNLGHVASGVRPYFYYPPLYFYLIAFIQIFSTNIWYLLSVVVFMNVYSIGIFYFIVKRLSGHLSAVLATILYACSFYILRNQYSLTAYRFDLPIFLTGTFLHLIGMQKKQSRYAVAGLFFLVVSASINYAILILIPVFLLWTFFMFRKHLEKPVYCTLFVYVLFIIIYFNFARYIIANYSWNTFFAPFLPQNNTTFIAGKFLPQVLNQFVVMTNNVFPEYTSLILWIIVGLFILYLIRNRSNRLAVFYPVSFLITTVVMAALKNDPPGMGSYYYYSVTPFLLMIIGICIQYRKPYGISILSGVCSLFLAWVAIRPTLGLYAQPKTYRIVESTAVSIMSELQNIQNQEHFPDMLFWRLRTISIWDAEWEMPTYAYFMEQKLGKLLHVYEHYHNLAWDGREDYIVIVCMTDKNTTIGWCKDDILRLYPGAVFIKQIPTASPYPVLLYKNK